jgi:SAM-dependent methyltransferase
MARKSRPNKSAHRAAKLLHKSEVGGRGRLPDGGIWSQYWHYDRIASCFDGAGAGNYDDCIAAGWRDFFAALPEATRIVDLCTGNGAAAIIAAETGRAAGKSFEIVAVDRADIDPPAYVSRHAEALAAIRFLPETAVEALPFPDSGFGAVISQYGIEYSNLPRALAEAVRVVAPAGRLRLVVHAADGAVAADARTVIAEADLLLGGIDLSGCARRCFTSLLAVERPPGTGDRAEADRAFAAFQAALEAAARHVPLAHDKTMFRNSGAVLLDTFKRRNAFDVDQLRAKVDEVEGEIICHRGRLAALVEAALDEAGVAALATRLRDAGASESGSARLESGGRLIGHVVTARF